MTKYDSHWLTVLIYFYKIVCSVPINILSMFLKNAPCFFFLFFYYLDTIFLFI